MAASSSTAQVTTPTTAPTPPVAATGNWRCSRCGLPNLAAAMKCTGCQGPRTGTESSSSSSSGGTRPASSRPIAPTPPGAAVVLDPFAALGAQKRFSTAPVPPPPKDARQQQKQIIDLLRKERKAWTIAEIKVHAEINIVEHPKLIEDLRAHPKVKVNHDMTFEYKPTHANIRSSADLEQFLQRQKYGILEAELNDAYVEVGEDIKRLAKEEKIYRIENTETKKVCLYTRSRMPREIVIDPRIQELWHKVMMPLTDGQLEEKLIQSGHRQKQEKKGPVAVLKQKTSGPRKKRRIKMTNTHLAGMGHTWIDDMASTSK